VRLSRASVVSIALIRGRATGVGSELALACDMRFASREPIVFVTTLITPEEARDSRRINGHRIVAKPARRSDLLRIVEESLPCCTAA